MRDRQVFSVKQVLALGFSSRYYDYDIVKCDALRRVDKRSCK
jgi:hypothetical protein